MEYMYIGTSTYGISYAWWGFPSPAGTTLMRVLSGYVLNANSLAEKALTRSHLSL